MGNARKGKGGKSASLRDSQQRVLSGDRCPCGKVRFLSKRDAKTTIGRMRSRTGRMHAYRCEDELGGVFWHIGHVPADLKHGEVTRADVEARRFA